MTAAEIIAKLKPLGSDSYKRVLFNHGIQEPAFGVKIEELKKIQKAVKKDHALSKELFETGVYDLQYLAGLIADADQMTKKDLKRWLAKGNCRALCGSIVAPVAAASAHGWELALEWIESKNEDTAQTGWATLGSYVSITDDDDLDIAALKKLLKRVEESIHDAPNRVRYTMNCFVIALGCYVAELTELAVAAGKKIGKVTVDMGETDCKVPSIPEYIDKVKKRGTIGKKRKSALC
jgi:3-methyladenine DNA glycosylase AlkD